MKSAGRPYFASLPYGDSGLRRLVGLDAQHVGKDAPLLGTEDSFVAAGVEHRQALIEGNRAQIAEGTRHHRLALRRLGGPALRGEVHPRAVLGRKALQHLGTGQAALPLLVGHLIHLAQLLRQPLLICRVKAPEAGVASQYPFLVLDG